MKYISVFTTTVITILLATLVMPYQQTSASGGIASLGLMDQIIHILAMFAKAPVASTLLIAFLTSVGEKISTFVELKETHKEHKTKEHVSWAPETYSGYCPRCENVPCTCT